MGRGGGGSSGGGGGGSFGGGGRSFGSSSGRSFGGRSGGSSGRGGSSSSGSFGSSRGGSINSGNVFRPTFVSVGNRKYYGGGGGGYNQNDNNNNNNSNNNNDGGNGGGKLGAAILVAFIVILFLVFFISAFGGDGGGVTKSTVERQPLKSGAVNETEYYTDNLDWIKSKTKLVDGMQHFYKKTGIQPYLYITDNINGKGRPTDDEVFAFATETYDKLFTDEAHFLVIFCESTPGEYNIWHLGGTQTKTIMDQEACDILLDYMDEYYYSDFDEDEFFATSFTDGADRIMTVTKSPVPVIIICTLAVLAIAMGFYWWKKIKEQKNLEAKQTEDILNTPIEEITPDEAEELSKKYENHN